MTHKIRIKSKTLLFDGSHTFDHQTSILSLQHFANFGPKFSLEFHETSVLFSLTSLAKLTTKKINHRVGGSHHVFYTQNISFCHKITNLKIENDISFWRENTEPPSNRKKEPQILLPVRDGYFLPLLLLDTKNALWYQC